MYIAVYRFPMLLRILHVLDSQKKRKYKEVQHFFPPLLYCPAGSEKMKPAVDPSSSFMNLGAEIFQADRPS